MSKLFTFVDERPSWILLEEKRMVCMYECPHFKNCKSLVGKECKQKGGTVIPQISKFKTRKLQLSY